VVDQGLSNLPPNAFGCDGEAGVVSVRDVQEQSQHNGGSLGWRLHSLAFPEQVMLYDRSDSLPLSRYLSLSLSLSESGSGCHVAPAAALVIDVGSQSANWR